MDLWSSSSPIPGSPRAGDTGMHPGEFGMSPEREISATLMFKWILCLNLWPLLAITRNSLAPSPWRYLYGLVKSSLLQTVLSPKGLGKSQPGKQGREGDGKEPAWKTGERRGWERASPENRREKGMGEVYNWERKGTEGTNPTGGTREMGFGMGLGMGMGLGIIPLTSAEAPPAARGPQPRSPPAAPPPAPRHGRVRGREGETAPVPTLVHPRCKPGTGPGTAPLQLRYIPGITLVPAWYIPGISPVPAPAAPGSGAAPAAAAPAPAAPPCSPGNGTAPAPPDDGPGAGPGAPGSGPAARGSGTPRAPSWGSVPPVWVEALLVMRRKNLLQLPSQFLIQSARRNSYPLFHLFIHPAEA